MSESTEVRRQVSEAYAKAASSPGASCCGPAPTSRDSSCCGTAPESLQQKGLAARIAGYETEDLRDLPSDAVVNSFGCGNPLAFSEVGPGEVVLDLGSGAGIDVILAARRVGTEGRAIGIDMTDEMIAHARDNIAAAGLLNAEVRKGIIEELPVETGSVDWVISNCVINLSPEKPRVFAEIARVLKPGGRFSISDIVVEELPDWMQQSAALYSACVAGAISEQEYLNGLRGAGLEAVEVTERLVYEASQIAAFVSSEESSILEVPFSPEQIEGAIAQVTGKIWSAKFQGHKPA